MFWLGNKKNNFLLHTFIWGPDHTLIYGNMLLFSFWKGLKIFFKKKGNYNDSLVIQLNVNKYEKMIMLLV